MKSKKSYKNTYKSPKKSPKRSYKRTPKKSPKSLKSLKSSIKIGNETVRFIKGKGHYKYTAIVEYKNGKEKRVNFGHKDYQHYKDSTPLKLYKDLDHNDKDRRDRYRARHSQIFLKDGRQAYKVKYTPAYFSWYYLW